MSEFYRVSNRARMSEMKEEARSRTERRVRFQTREKNRPVRTPGELLEKPYAEFDAVQKRAYGILCREERAAYGLTDGLRLDRGEFNDYLSRRRAEDAKARGWR
jgi:hypothetical protein